MKLKPLMITSALVGITLSLAACSPPDNAPGPAPASTPDPTATAAPGPGSGVHEEGHANEDPAKVALALEAAKIMTTWNPAKDFNRTDAEMRARKLMTAERAKEVIAPERPATGEEWLNAAAKKATSQPTVKIETAHHEQNSIAVNATWQWVTADGETWAGEGKTTFFFTFTDKAPYQIRDYTASGQ
ncbi:hypothetical protein ACFY5D_21095 [Paeniglutamicibacter sp. NPDC012692]|uniref:hypothetical protein n=1 Tax=Paeniglutamicibacter sp. NPDC012692 TaxID=3364388 RepID=UPI0036A70D70